ncbi:C40 family peptidase [Georgenia sp. AZ-5]|uniref:C40 family peptidase n=1 Tax=Georgenia sp. AZ-5 TaxID=3367526 RepID=UPI0037542E94
MTSTTKARHRAARRPSTPLTTLGHRIGAPDARRGLATVATSGLVLGMAATSAAAAGPEATALPRVDVSAAAAEAVTAMITTPTVTVPADVTWSVESVAAAKATPAPVRESLAARSTESASRTGTRAQLADAVAEAQTATAAAPTVAAPAASASASAVVDFARQFIGTPYVYGGTTPEGFDCSGFTQYVYAQFGVSLPRTSGAQASAGVRVSAAEARPGDLVAWPGHVGIYTGNGNNIAARQPGTPLSETPIYRSDAVFVRVI